MLDSEDLPSSDVVESEDWLAEGGGLTGLLSEAGLTNDASEIPLQEAGDDPSLTDMLENNDLVFEDDLEQGLPSLTDMLDSEDLPSADVFESEDDWLAEGGGLTGLLSEDGLTQEEKGETR